MGEEMEREETTTSGTTFKYTKRRTEEEEVSIHPFNIREIYKRIEDLDEMVDLLKDRADSLERKIESPPVNVRIVEVKETTVEEAKKKILAYYERHKEEWINPADVADEIGLDLKVTMEAVEELVKEGNLE